MAWIEIHQELGRHPKLYKLVRLLGIDHPTAVGHLLYLWWWALDFAKDGCLAKYDDDELATAAKWKGDAKKFMEGLIGSGFAERATNGNVMLHDWDDYGGKLLQAREKDKERKRAAKESKGNPKDSNGNPTESDGTPDDSTVTIHNITIHKDNNTKDNITLQNNVSKCSSASSDAHLQTVAKNASNSNFDASDENFAIFWKEYPRKISKKTCQGIWRKLKISDELFQQIMTALREYKGCEQWTTDDGKYIPYPATWLKQARWNDVLTVTPPSPPPTEDYQVKSALEVYLQSKNMKEAN